MTHEDDFVHEHTDRVTVIQVNHDGSKLLTASIDHRVTIFEVNTTNGQRKSVDKFTAHDADIRDAKWLHPSTGTQFATIGNDLQLRIWQEDTFQAPHSGRRFRRIATIPSSPRIPFVSLDTKTVDNTTYIAVIDRQGLLSIYEPTNPDEYNDWTLIDQFNVCIPPPPRGENTSFRVTFDPNPFPLPYITYMSDDRAQLSLAVTSMNEVKVYRSTNNAMSMTPEQQSSSGSSPLDIGGGPSANHRLMFFEAARLPPRPALVRGVAWAPSNVRGVDTIATCSRDGTVCIFEVGLSNSAAHPNPRAVRALAPAPAGEQQQQSHPQSTLTSAFASSNHQQQGQQQQQQPTSSSTVAGNGTPEPFHQSRTANPFPYIHKANLVSTIPSAHNDAWNVSFDPSGQLLMTGGADGSSKIWRRSTLGALAGEDGAAVGGGGVQYLLFADAAIGTSESDSSDDESE